MKSHLTALAPLLIATTACFHTALAEETFFPAGSEWETVGEGYNVVKGIAAKNGTLFYTDVPDSELYRLAPGKPEFLMDKATAKANGLAFGPDGILYAACMEEPRITGWNLESGERIQIPLPSPANDLAITVNGHLYCTWSALSAVYHLNLAKPEPVKAAEMPNPNGITLNRDGTELWVGEFRGDTVRAFPILADGALGPARPAFKVKVPADGKGLIDGMTPLADGRLLVATALGLQVVSGTAPPVLIPNPTPQRANYVRIITDAAGKRWMYVAHVKTLLRRLTTLEPSNGKSPP
jgi:gluconolactonase